MTTQLDARLIRAAARAAQDQLGTGVGCALEVGSTFAGPPQITIGVRVPGRGYGEATLDPADLVAPDVEERVAAAARAAVDALPAAGAPA